MSDNASHDINAPPPSSIAPCPTSQLSRCPLTNTIWKNSYEKTYLHENTVSEKSVQPLSTLIIRHKSGFLV